MAGSCASACFDPDRAYRLADQSVLRPEPFGALGYHYGERRLNFLRCEDLVALVESLGRHHSPRAAFSASHLDESRWPSFSLALARLAASGFLVAEDRSEPSGFLVAEDRSEPAGFLVADDRSEPAAPGRMWARGAAGSAVASPDLSSDLAGGLSAPICLTWELTYACNLQCIHCLSSSGRRDPDELSTAEAEQVFDELQALGVFYVNIGGGEPTIRGDFWHLLRYGVDHGVGVKFSSNGFRIDESAAADLAAMDYVDVQISIDGADAATNDALRGGGSYVTAISALDRLQAAGFEAPKISVVVTRHNMAQLDAFESLAERYGAQLRLTRLRPSGRGVDSWSDLHPTPAQQVELYHWLLERPEVLTGDSFFHLSALGEPLPGLNLCGAGRVVCLIDPVGDVYACPFVLHEDFLAGSVRDPGGFGYLWRNSELFAELRRPRAAGACASCGQFDACGGGCMAAKFFTGIPIDGPDPECVKGHGAALVAAATGRPSVGKDHSRSAPLVSRSVPVAFLGRTPLRALATGP